MHCLNLKITYECTNHCSFCFSSYLRDTIIPLESLKKAVLQGHQNGCKILVLSGGEPTLYPEYIMELMTLAKDHGYDKIIIQTNGHGIAKNKNLLHFLDDFANSSEVCISFSLHGHIPSIHDNLSCNIGAFNTTTSAISVISKSHCKLYTNTVVNALNIRYLRDIAKLLLPYNPTVMQ